MALRTLFILFIASLLISCTRNITSGSGSDNLVIYPSPPDTARIQFLTRISSSHDVTGNRNSFARFILGQDEDILINKPYGVALGNGKIFICDTYIHGLDVIDMATNKFEQFVPSGKGELKVPINCFVDKKGYLYIADSERKQVVIFDKNGEYVSCLGEAENFKPVDVFVQDDKIWVTNLAGHQIHVYNNDSSHELLNTFPEINKSDPGSLFSPTNLFVTENKVYVTDFGDFKVKIYTHEGEFIQSVGSYGQGIGQFIRPKGIAVDRDTNLFVVDAGFENTQIFSKEGNLLMFFGGNYKGPGDMWLPAKVTLDYDNLKYFEKFVDPSYNLKYLIFVTNQFGPDKLSIYGAIEPLKPGQIVKQNTRNKKQKKKGNKQGPMF
jgi:DNA-binding beta-propeller fold protein YncE